MRLPEFSSISAGVGCAWERLDSRGRETHDMTKAKLKWELIETDEEEFLIRRAKILGGWLVWAAENAESGPAHPVLLPGRGPQMERRVHSLRELFTKTDIIVNINNGLPRSIVWERPPWEKQAEPRLRGRITKSHLLEEAIGLLR